MIKEVIKEIIIIILLCCAILLILSVSFYNQNPWGILVPDKIAYTVPDNIKAELEEVVTQEKTLKVDDKVYTIEGTDLNAYKSSATYNPSKQNPFANTIIDSASTQVNTNVNNNNAQEVGGSTATTTSANANVTNKVNNPSNTTEKTQTYGLK